MKQNIILATLFLLVSFYSCYSQKFRSYTDEENGFTISYPVSWKKLSPSKKNAAKFVASFLNNDHVEASAIITFQPNINYVQDSVYYHYMRGLHLHGEKVLVGGESIINQQKFYWFTTLIDNHLEYIKNLYYITLHDDKLIIVKFSANQASKYDYYEALFQKIANSIKL